MEPKIIQMLFVPHHPEDDAAVYSDDRIYTNAGKVLGLSNEGIVYELQDPRKDSDWCRWYQISYFGNPNKDPDEDEDALMKKNEQSRKDTSNN